MAVTQAQVAQLYVALFNRAPEGAGFNAWVAAGATKTVAQMANEMLASPATPPYFASLGIDISTDRGYVENIYKNILGKDYSRDPDGINAWVRHLQLGNSRGDTLVKLFEVATSAEARIADPVAAQTFANKTAISQYAAQKIADIPTDENGAYDFSLFQRIIAQTNNTNLDAQKAAIDALVAPTVHNLSSDANNVSGTDRADLFNGAVSATVNQTTFKDTDKIDGKGGNDTLNLDMYTNFYGLATDRGEVKNIENLKLTNHTSGHLTFNARNIHDMQTISIDGSTYKYGLDIINPENKVKLNLKNIDLSQTGAQNLRLIYNTDVLAGTNDDQEVTVDNVKTGNNKINITTVNNDKVEAVTINALSGVNKLTGFISDHVGSSDDSSIKTIKVKGSAELEITGPSSLQTFDASAYTGNKLTANLKANGSVQHIIGSSQDDTFNVTGATGAIIPINGGAGRDVVNILNTISGNKHVEMSGVEELNVNPTNAPSAHTQLDFSRAQEIDTLGIGGEAIPSPHHKNVTVLNSNIKTVNINSDGETIVGLRDASLENYNVKKGTTTTLLSGAAQKLNVNVDAQTSGYFALEGGTGLKELNLTLTKTANTSYRAIIQDRYDSAEFKTMNVVNNTANALENSISTKLADGTTATNTSLKILNVETKGDYELKYNTGGLSKINLKGTGDETKVELVTQTGQSLGMRTDGRYPLQGTQDITLNAQNLKTLKVAAISGGKIITTRDVSLTSTTDKEDASVSYGFIGHRDTVPANTYKVNNATINATGQKTLEVASINAAGDVNLTTHFTQQGSSAQYGANINAYTIGRNVTIKHTSEANVTDGEIYVANLLKADGDLNITASGYKTLKIGDTTNATQVGGTANINTTATVAGSTTNFVMGITGATNGINITASAANGINDASFRSGNIISNKKDINITMSSQKSVDIGNVTARGVLDTANNEDNRGDVNITTTTSIANSTVSIGTVSSAGKNVNLNFSGQKTLSVGAVTASDPTTEKTYGDININVRGGGSFDSTSPSATFGAISGVDVTLNADNLSALTLGAVTAEKDVSINTGTSIGVNFAGAISGKKVSIDASNATLPLTDNSSSTTTIPYKISINAATEASVKSYSSNSLNYFGINVNPTLSTEKHFTAEVINGRGGMSSVTANAITETITLKGGVTNPDSVMAAYTPSTHSYAYDPLDPSTWHESNQNYAAFAIDTKNMTALKSIDASGYNNPTDSDVNNFVGIVKIFAKNDALETIVGSNVNRTQVMVNDDGAPGSTGLKSIKTSSVADWIEIKKAQVNNIKIESGAGDDTIYIGNALTANKKFEISGGAGNDKFILGGATTDANASKYITITDANRGDKIAMGSTAATTFQKINLNVDSRADLKTAINDALASVSGSTNVNTIYAVAYKNDTYLVRDADTNKVLGTGDNLVKLAGVSNFDLLSANGVEIREGAYGTVHGIEITNM